MDGEEVAELEETDEEEQTEEVEETDEEEQIEDRRVLVSETSNPQALHWSGCLKGNARPLSIATTVTWGRGFAPLWLSSEEVLGVGMGSVVAAVAAASS